MLGLSGFRVLVRQSFRVLGCRAFCLGVFLRTGDFVVTCGAVRVGALA